VCFLWCLLLSAKAGVATIPVRGTTGLQLHLYGSRFQSTTGVRDGKRISWHQPLTKRRRLFGLKSVPAISLNNQFFLLVVSMGGSAPIRRSYPLIETS